MIVGPYFEAAAERARLYLEHGYSGECPCGHRGPASPRRDTRWWRRTDDLVGSLVGKTVRSRRHRAVRASSPRTDDWVTEPAYKREAKEALLYHRRKAGVPCFTV